MGPFEEWQMPLAAGTRLGPYEITAWIGAGGMGDVYRATDTRLGRTVAIKVLPDQVAGSPTRRARLAREARAVSLLSHPSICTLYDIGEHDGTQFIVMEHLEGETLSQRLLRGALPIADVARVGAEIASALDHAHRKRIVHRDLKPTNIMLTPVAVKVLDFGLAHLESPNSEADGSTADVEAPSATESLTEEGVILGTVRYMSPEQLEGKRVDGRTDIFATGAVLYEMATGRPAFEGGSKAAVIAAILERSLPPVSIARHATSDDGSVLPLLDDIVARCLAKNPEERWQSASDLSQALKWAEAGRPHAGPPLRSRGSRHVRLAWIAASVLLLASLMAVMTMWSRDRAPLVNRPSRWSITMPEGSTLDPSPFSLAVSPDGTHLAFIASSGKGGNTLWIRPLDSIVPRKLADGAAQPFWSADSRFIGFEGGGHIKKVELATGLVQTLADTYAISGSWSREGVLLLALPPGERRNNSGGLYSVSASGGQLKPATTLDPVRAGNRHAAPHFLPDGRRFLFRLRSPDPQQDGMLFAGSLDSPERTRLFQSPSRAIYGSGHLLTVRDQTLLARRFDPISLRLEGEPLIVAEGVDQGLGGAFSVSDTGVLAFRPERQTELVWFDREGRSLGAIEQPGQYANPALSPDEQRVAVSRQDPAGGAWRIWIIDVKRAMTSKLTFGETSQQVPLWSADGRRVVYRSGSSLVVKAASGAGTEERVIDTFTNFDNPLGWSSDGRMLLYTSFDSTSSTDFWLLPLEGHRTPIPLPKSSSRWGAQAQISPDGRWLAYASNESGRYDVYVRPFPSGEGRWLISANGGSEPTWRRDGKELYYLAGDGALMAVALTNGSTFEHATPTRLFATKMSTLVNTSITRNQYVPSADGRHFLVNQAAGTPDSITVVVDWPAALKNRQ